MKSRLKNDAADTEDSRTVSKARENLDRFGEKASEYYEEGLEKARAFEQRFEEIVREYPVRSILVTATVAAGIGLIVGCFTRKR